MITSKYSKIYCSVCGRMMGKKPGAQVSLGLICDDLLCSVQEPAGANQQRDAFIVSALLEGVPATQVAFATGMSRQRVYQIYDTWRSGV